LSRPEGEVRLKLTGFVGFALGVFVTACAPSPDRKPSSVPSEALAETELPSSTPGLRAVPADGLRIDSEYSRIVVRETGTERTLSFLDDQGKEHVESRMDVADPSRLVLPYARSMFVSYLFTPEPERVLLIGLGAGSMVRFLERFDSKVRIDAVDIDPVVLDVARDYFGTRESERVHLIAADGFDFVERAEAVYDVIYLDAFLKPMPAKGATPDAATDVDASGVPRRLKTIETYRKMQSKLRPGGVIVVNLHYMTLNEDVTTLREALGRGHLFDVPGSGNYILVGTSSEDEVSPSELFTRGQAVDARLGADFSFAELGRRLLRDLPK
jgi:spermidine synthase